MRDLLEGQSNIHHIFPRKYLQDQGLTRSSYNQIANYVVMQSEITFITGYIVANCEESFYRSIGFDENEGHLEGLLYRQTKVMNGALVFAGTRVPVEILIQHLTAGDSLNKFLEDFPTVSQEQVVAYLKMTLEVTDARVA